MSEKLKSKPKKPSTKRKTKAERESERDIEPLEFDKTLANVHEDILDYLEGDTVPATAKARLSNGLTLRQNFFVECYIANGGNPRLAVKQAGYKSKNIGEHVERLMADPNVHKAIYGRMNGIMRTQGLNPEQVVSELMSIAFSNVKDIMDWDGATKTVTLKNSKDISKYSAQAIAEVNQTTVAGGHKSIKVKMYNKLDALDKLAKMLGVYQDTIKVMHETQDDRPDEVKIKELESLLRGSGMIIDAE